MKVVYIADTGVFVRCGGPGNAKYQRLRRAVRRAEIALHIPRRVYEEIGGTESSTVDGYPSSEIPWQAGIEEGWIVVADDLDYTNPLVATVMDQTRRFIANDTDRAEDRIEKTDTALVGLAAQLLEKRKAAQVVLLTTDKPAGRAAETCFRITAFRDRSSIGMSAVSISKPSHRPSSTDHYRDSR
jgi:hypothetical protein